MTGRIIDTGGGTVDAGGATATTGTGGDTLTGAGGDIVTGAGGAIVTGAGAGGDIVTGAGGDTVTGAGGAIVTGAGAGGDVVTGGGTLGAAGSLSAVHAGGATDAAASSQPRSISISVFAGDRTGVSGASNVGTFGGVNESGGVEVFIVAARATPVGAAGGTADTRGGGGVGVLCVLYATGEAGGPDLIGLTAIPTMSASSRSSVGMRSRIGAADVLISEGFDTGAGGGVDVDAAGATEVRGRGIDGRTLALMPFRTSKPCSVAVSRRLPENPARSPRHYIGLACVVATLLDRAA